jgi:hypothetical protein
MAATCSTCHHCREIETDRWECRGTYPTAAALTREAIWPIVPDPPNTEGCAQYWPDSEPWRPQTTANDHQALHVAAHIGAEVNVGI